MSPKKRTRQQDQPSESLQEIREKRAKLAKWLPGGEKGPEQEQTEQDPEHQPDQPGQSVEAPEQAGKNDKIYKLICTLFLFNLLLYKIYIKKEGQAMSKIIRFRANTHYAKCPSGVMV